MPTRHPDKPRAKSILGNERKAIDEREKVQSRVADVPQRRTAEKRDPIDNVDWLALWALSLAVSAMFIAALVYFGEGDAPGAAAVLAGTAGIISIALIVTKAPGDRD